ncbi:MAG: tRNA pseudouridine(55) synthase TruB [Clostridia bacterium]|nr:tRNA pseudouridine(55) synthase TruB [Clostridia bacterium]
MNGIVNAYKPKGVSSHDVIYKVRRALNTRKVGHTGTLDPLAEGVLPICVGKATKIVEYIMAAEKEYLCTINFGAETDTQDITGSVTASSEKRITRVEFEETLTLFVGSIKQIPPMYSAVHHNGERLYKLARQGIEVERQPREITVFGIDIIKYEKDCADILVRCSKGTYIRTLCEDIGRKTGTLAYMSALKRTRSGVFTLENCIPIEEISEDKLIPIDAMFENCEKVVLNPTEKARVLNGVPVRRKCELGVKYRVYDEDGNLLCLSEGAQDGNWQILKMLKSFY